ncbi:MAG TPA: hypothetical protein ENH59_10500 [Bacteroidetes bacterium]|nr:hypothetical protein [Bacteroidota bacterium]
MNKALIIAGIVIIASSACTKEDNLLTVENKYIIDHTAINISDIPDYWIEKAKEKLHIAYGHTSHGSQITTGMTGLVTFLGSEYAWNNGGADGALDLHDYAMSGDLGSPNFTGWELETRDYLASNEDVNVIIWSWCGQVSYAAEENIDTYLGLMSGLEEDFPGVIFVYMTGHLDGTGLTGNLHLRNEQIRNYCKTNNKFLYDFADIESWDPDGNYYLDKAANDGCYYDSNNDGTRDSNWAVDWQNAHTEGVDWYTCTAAHTQPLNANMKAYAAWHLWARIAGWS